MHYHVPKPFYRKSRDTWYVEVDGRQINLGKDRKTAFQRYHAIMASPPEVRPTHAMGTGEGLKLTELFDRFLDWVKHTGHRIHTSGINTGCSDLPIDFQISPSDNCAHIMCRNGWTAFRITVRRPRGTTCGPSNGASNGVRHWDILTPIPSSTSAFRHRHPKTSI